MPINAAYKEKYQSFKIQIDMVREKSILATLPDDRVINIPRSAISYASQRGFGRIMTFPVIQEIEIAGWLVRKENL